MSFSSLPPELVHQIFESTVPHSFHSKTYHERQRTLCSLSLVSRLCRSIAQPLLFEIVKLNRLKDVVKLPQTRALAQSASFRRSSRGLVIAWDGSRFRDCKQEEKDQVLESLRNFASVTNLTAVSIGQEGFEVLLAMTSEQLTYLNLSEYGLTKPSGLHLPRLYNLTLFSVSLELFNALTDPATVPNVRNFAFVTPHPSCAQYFTQSPFHQLLPKLHTLTLSAAIWFDSRAAYLHSAASRTLVDFDFVDSGNLELARLTLRHVRLLHSSLLSLSFSNVELQAQLDQWSTFIENNPSLPLQSIYLDSSLLPFDALPDAVTRRCLENLARVCKEHKIDLIFEASPVKFALDPYISEEFIRKQGQQRRKEAEGRGEIAR
ncbi:hypothetical protein JCM5350_002289 [Sporobolomyces pararoseus]